MNARKIYAASSWRNLMHPTVVTALREWGHEVYDFRNPAPGNTGFGWHRHCPEVNCNTIPGYLQAVQSVTAQKAFELDKAALDWCDTGVLVLPCGRSAHLEAGYLAGQGKRVYFLLHEDQFEPELMYLLGTRCITTYAELQSRLQLEFCPGCKNEFDPDVCHCGDSIEEHTSFWNHSPVPMGCTCGYLRDIHPQDTTNDLAISLFCEAMKQKMVKSRVEKGRGGWETATPEILARMLVEHVAKGDPIDIGNLAMMLFHKQEGTMAGSNALRAAAKELLGE